MRIPFLFRILFLITWLPSVIIAQDLDIENPIRFLALGDSYTIGQSVPASQRWPAQLRDSLSARGFETDTLTIIATTGWRTDNLIGAIRNKDLESKNYNLVSLLIGVNNQFQNRPFSQYVNEFPALLDSAIRYAGGDKSNVFVVSIPDYAFTPFGQGSSDPDKISMEIDQYNAFSKSVADSLDITYFDITPISRLGLQIPSYVANDGLHPSGVQYTEWVKLMLAFIDSQITGIPSSQEDYILNALIYPNPTSGEITISFIDDNLQETCHVQIYNLTGQLLEENTFSGRRFEVSVADLPDGFYVIKINSNEKYAVKKILKKAS